MEIKVTEIQQLYASPKEICKAYSLGRNHVYSLLRDMKANRRYRDGVVAYSKVIRVKLAVFDEFWREYAARH